MPSREACASCAVKRSSPIRSRRSRGERKRTRSRAPRAAPSSASASPATTRVSSGAPRRASRASSASGIGARRAGAPVAAALPQDLTASSSRACVQRSSASSHTGPVRRDGPGDRLEAERAGADLRRLEGGAEREQRRAVAEVQQRGPRRVDPRADDVRPRLEAPGLHVPAGGRRARAGDDEADLLGRRRPGAGRRHPRPAPAGAGARLGGGRRRQRRLAPVGGQLVEIGVEAPRGGELAERDAPHGVGHHRAAERDVGGELRPRGDALLDLDHRGRRPVREARRVEDADHVRDLLLGRQAAELGRGDVAEQPVERRPIAARGRSARRRASRDGSWP